MATRDGTGAGRMPRVMWVSLAALGLFNAMYLVMGVSAGGSDGAALVASGVLGFALLWGLAIGSRIAFVALLVIVPLKLVALLASADVGRWLLIALLDAVVVAPMLIAARWFWRDRGAAGVVAERYGDA